EIRKYQKSTEFLIRKLPVQRLVREDDDGFWDMKMTRNMESGSSTLEGVISQSKIRRKANWKRVASAVLVAIGSHLPDL
nr:histone H3 [Tanacetum cinerariifolium]